MKTKIYLLALLGGKHICGEFFFGETISRDKLSAALICQKKFGGDLQIHAVTDKQLQLHKEGVSIFEQLSLVTAIRE